MQSWIEERYGNQDLFDFYAANVAENENLVADYVEDIGLEVPVLLVTQQVDEQYMIRGNASPYPLDYIIDGNRIVQYAQHEYEPELMQITLDRLLEINQAPEIVISMDSLDFGEVVTGAHADLPIRLWNIGNSNLVIRDCTINNEFFRVDFEGQFSIVPGDSSDILFTFSPDDSTAFGALNGMAVISSNDPERSQTEIYLRGIGVRFGDVDIDKTDGIPSEFFISEAYPNPFNLVTTIQFGLPINSKVEITVFDISGKFACSVFDGRLSSGVHQVKWMSSDLPTGVYLLRMQAGDFDACRKIVLIK